MFPNFAQSVSFDRTYRKHLGPIEGNTLCFLPSLRARTAKTLICRKSGASADSRKRRKTALFAHFCALFTQKVWFSTLSGSEVRQEMHKPFVTMICQYFSNIPPVK